MADFTLTPDDPDDAPAGQLSFIETGAVDLDDLPTSRRGKDHPPAQTLCEACGRLVLHGLTTDGQRIVLDTAVQTYTLFWATAEPTPRLALSRAYPEHRCHP